LLPYASVRQHPTLRAAIARHPAAMRDPCVYLLASHYQGTLYCGVTSNLVKRVWEHRNHVVRGFTERYAVTQLVWFEQHDTIEPAIAREKAIKEWKRAWKIRLIERHNPYWRDLYETILP
jgi:putative endonuclease